MARRSYEPIMSARSSLGRTAIASTSKQLETDGSCLDNRRSVEEPGTGVRGPVDRASESSYHPISGAGSGSVASRGIAGSRRWLVSRTINGRGHHTVADHLASAGYNAVG